MPIDVALHNENRLRIEVFEEPPEVESQLYVLLAGLLTSQFVRAENCWLVSFLDFCHLRQKLDLLGLTHNRSASLEALEWINQKHAEYAASERLKRGEVSFDLPGLSELKTKLYEDQVIGTRFLFSRNAAVLADEMGSGKTLQLLTTFVSLKAAGLAKYLLVASPNSVKMTWIKEVLKHTHLTASHLGNGTKQTEKDFKEYAKNRADVLVVHYDAIAKVADPKRAVSELAKQMLAVPWDVIVLDEAHYLKDTDTKRTQAWLSFVRSAKQCAGGRSRLYMATGTPISESPLDAWSVFEFLDPNALPKTYSKFESYFTIKETKQGTTKTWRATTGYRNLAELKETLHNILIRRLKVDMRGFPDKVEQTRFIQLAGQQKELYDEIKEGLHDAIVKEEGNKLSIMNAMTRCLRLRQTLNHPLLVGRNDIAHSAKYEALDEVLAEVLSDPLAKAVVWTEWREAAEVLTQRYQKQYGAITLIGGTTQEELLHYSKNWDHMPQRVAVCTPKFGGTGIDFLQRCRTAIYVEPPYSTILFRQSMDRIHRRTAGDGSPMDRIKSTPATLVFLQVIETIDQLVYDILARKGSLVDALLTEDAKLIQLGKEELLAYLR